MAIKQDKESGSGMDDVLEMRDVMVRTGNDICTLVIYMTRRGPWKLQHVNVCNRHYLVWTI